MPVEDIKPSKVLATGTSKGVLLCFVGVLLKFRLVLEFDRTLNTNKRMPHFNPLMAINVLTSMVVIRMFPHKNMSAAWE